MKNLFAEKKPFIGYLTAGDGGMEHSVESFLSLVEGGVDILEIGVPFSDPVADGKTIQKAMERSLDCTPEDVLTIVQKIREKSDVPIILFSYFNPIFIQGEAFLKKAKKAGVDAFLLVDLPFEESFTMHALLKKHDLDLIPLITPSTSKERLREIAERGAPFLYYVAQKGTTGMREGIAEDFSKNVQEIKSVVKQPVVSGFGIRDRDSAKVFLENADGFVVGSFFVDKVEKKASLKEAAKNLDPRGSS